MSMDKIIAKNDYDRTKLLEKERVNDFVKFMNKTIQNICNNSKKYQKKIFKINNQGNKKLRLIDTNEYYFKRVPKCFKNFETNSKMELHLTKYKSLLDNYSQQLQRALNLSYCHVN